MKHAWIIAALLLASPAFAQQAGEADTAQQLLAEANGRIVALARQLAMAEKRAAEAEAKAKACEKPATPAPAPEKK